MGSARDEPGPHRRCPHQKHPGKAEGGSPGPGSDCHSSGKRLFVAGRFMKLGVILFLAHLVILGLCFSYPLEQIGSRVRTAYLESAEEPLVDTANILAALV